MFVTIKFISSLSVVANVSMPLKLWIQPCMGSRNTGPIVSVCAGTELLTSCVIMKTLTVKDVGFLHRQRAVYTSHVLKTLQCFERAINEGAAFLHIDERAVAGFRLS